MFWDVIYPSRRLADLVLCAQGPGDPGQVRPPRHLPHPLHPRCQPCPPRHPILNKRTTITAPTIRKPGMHSYGPQRRTPRRAATTSTTSCRCPATPPSRTGGLLQVGRLHAGHVHTWRLQPSCCTWRTSPGPSSSTTCRTRSLSGSTSSWRWHVFHLTHKGKAST